MCISNSLSIPLSLCHTSSLDVLCLKSTSFRLAACMFNLDVCFLFYVHPLLTGHTHVQSRCALLILDPPSFALLRACHVATCSFYFQSTPHSPCHTHLQSRCVFLLVNPLPIRLARHTHTHVYNFGASKRMSHAPPTVWKNTAQKRMNHKGHKAQELRAPNLTNRGA